ncbi:MAG: hypothetical protein IT384_27110 [Deltaproteobacteria bacterium]|nr:hypothetical protein [Deltaproteobacteria bacterium]
MGARLKAAVWAGLLAGCGPPGVLVIEVPLGEGARSVLVARERSGTIELAAADAGGPVGLPSLPGYDGSTPLRFSALYYGRSLQQLGLTPGVIAASAEGDPIPGGAAEIQVRTVDDAGDGRWEVAPSLPAWLSGFRSAAFAPIVESCVADYAIELKTPVHDRVIEHVHSLGPSAVLLVTSAPLSRSATGSIARLDEDGRFTYLHPDALISPVAGCGASSGILSDLWTAPDGEIWAAAAPCGGRLFGLYHGRFGVPLVRVAPQPDPRIRINVLSGVVTGTTTVIFGVSAGRDLWRYRPVGWDRLATFSATVRDLVALGPDEVAGIFSDGTTLFHHARGETTTVGTTNSICAFGRCAFGGTPIGPVAIEGDALGTGAVVRAWRGSAWDVLEGYPRTQVALTVGAFRDGFIYSGLTGSIITYLPAAGFCPSVDGKLGFDASGVAPLGDRLVFVGTRQDFSAAPVAIATPL